MSELSSILKQRRKELGLTLAQIAEAMGVAEATVQRWESGNIKTIRREKIGKLAEILKVSPTALIDLEGNCSYDELIDIYIRGAKKWADDFRFSEKQKERIIEYLADSASKLKTVVNAMADAQKSDGKILMNTSLQSALEDISHWTGNAVKYVNEDFSNDPFSEENIKKQFLSAISNLSRRDQVAWLIRLQDYIEEKSSITAHTIKKEEST